MSANEKRRKRNMDKPDNVAQWQEKWSDTQGKKRNWFADLLATNNGLTSSQRACWKFALANGKVVACW